MEAINWEAIGAALAAPFSPADVEYRVQGGTRASEKDGLTYARVVAYIDARAVQQRLDAVVGIGGWQFDWCPVPASGGGVAAKGTLTILGLSKSDIGDGAGDEANKTAVSDALKRAGVMWGIGRYLYSLPCAWVKVEMKGKQAVPLKGEIARLRATLPKAA